VAVLIKADSPLSREELLIGAGESSGDNAGTMPFPVWVTVTKPEITAAGATQAARACPHQGVAAVGAAVVEAAALVVEEAVDAVNKHSISLKIRRRAQQCLIIKGSGKKAYCTVLGL
jgi:hypothetical protein